MATLAPSCAKRTAIAWPMPDEAPVISVFLPSSLSIAISCHIENLCGTRLIPRYILFGHRTKPPAASRGSTQRSGREVDTAFLRPDDDGVAMRQGDARRHAAYLIRRRAVQRAQKDGAGIPYGCRHRRY